MNFFNRKPKKPVKAPSPERDYYKEFIHKKDIKEHRDVKEVLSLFEREKKWAAELGVADFEKEIATAEKQIDLQIHMYKVSGKFESCYTEKLALELKNIVYYFKIFMLTLRSRDQLNEYIEYGKACKALLQRNKVLQEKIQQYERQIKSPLVRSNSLVPCKAGTVRDPVTNRCKKPTKGKK